jgi:hypothetical protein
MIVSVFVLLFLFGGGAAVVALIGFAIASKRLWIIPAGIALAFFGLIAAGLLASIVFFQARRDSATVTARWPAELVNQASTTSHTVINATPNFNISGSIAPNWIHLSPWVVVIAVLLVVLTIRRLTSPHAGHGLRRAWPVVVILLLVAMMFLGSTRSSYRAAQIASAEAATRESALEAATRQQILALHANAKIVSQHSGVPTDIEAFDAPLIPISADAPKAPAAPSAPAPTAPAPSAVAPSVAVAKSSDNPVASDDKSAANTNKGDAPKSAVTANHKHKKTDKTPAKADAKQSQLVTQSKPAESTTGGKESASSSVEPDTIGESKTEKLTTRPNWLDESPKRTGNTRREVIITEPYATVDECYQAGDIYLLLKTYQRMQELVGNPYSDRPLPSLTFANGQVIAEGQVVSYGQGSPFWADPRLRTLSDAGIGVDYVRREIVAKDSKTNESREFVETVEQSFGPMKKLYLQIEFTPATDRDLRLLWDSHKRNSRFAMVGAGAGSLLTLLGMAFALLKIDTWTKGYYTKRLFIGVPAAIITGIVLLSTLASLKFIR